jgi:hypothetical protein
MVQSFANEFVSWPDAPFFLRHVMSMNYAGKVYAVLRGIEVATQVSFWPSFLFITYAIFMTLGMYWYTRFWSLEKDIDAYYDSESRHYLQAYNVSVTLGAAFYYFVFAILFTVSHTYEHHPVSLSLAIWNAWCFINLLLATPLF